MLKVDIPSYKNLRIEYVVFDYNGTLAVDGFVKDEIKKKIKILRDNVEIYVLTADTYGNVKKNIRDVNVRLHIISKENGRNDKADFIIKLGPEKCIAVGNGNNDSLMIKEAALGICILGEEGCFAETLLNSDIVVKNINDCLDLLINTDRLKATLRG